MNERAASRVRAVRALACTLASLLAAPGCADHANSGAATPETAGSASSDPGAPDGRAAQVGAGGPTDLARPGADGLAQRTAPGRPASGRGWVGVLAARDAADVAAEVAGRVAEVRVRIGDGVEAGQIVAVLAAQPFRNELDVALAAERAARAAFDAAVVDVAETERSVERERALHARGASAKSQLEAAEFARDKAAAARDRDRATAAERAAQVAQLRVRLANTEIRAPFAGVVAVRYLDPGAIAEVGAPVVRVIAAGSPRVVFAVPADHARALTAGDRVRVLVEPVSVTVSAVIRNIAPELEPASQMVVVEAELESARPDTPDAAGEPAPNDALKAGQAVRVFPAE